jgi:hypothetical protein
MTHPIIKTENYLLVVDDSEIKQSDWIYNEEREPSIVQCIGKGSLRGWAKIIYHLPLNNAPTLEGVPLLPPLEDEDISNLTFQAYKEQDKWTWGEFKDIFPAGYNKAKEKYKYTEQDLRKAWNAAYINALSDEETHKPLFFEDFMQSRQQPKYPVAFESETVTPYTDGYADDRVRRFYGVPEPKTITNSQGLTQLVGKYVYL